MSASDHRKQVPKRDAAQADMTTATTTAAAESSISPPEEKMRDEDATKVVFIDDEIDFLKSLEIAARTHISGIDLRTIQATHDNHLLDAMDQLAAQGWLPDLLCIDLNEASGKGISGTECLIMMRSQERWLRLPIILTTKTKEIKQEELRNRRSGDLVHTVYKSGADGYLLGKEGDRRYLQSIINQYPAWRYQARNRLWQSLLEDNRRRLQAAKNEADQKVALEKTLETLHVRLGIDHAFVRKGTSKRCPVWVKFNGPWTDKDNIEDLLEIPLMLEVIEGDGTVTKIKKIAAKDRGVFKELDGKAYMGCALMLHEEFLGVMTVICDREDSFGPLDEFHFGRLTEQVAYMLGKHWLEERNRKLREALLQFSEKLSATHDENAVCQTLAETAHAVLHDGHRWAKCTVRLIEPGYPLLRLYGQAGDAVPRGDIPRRLTEISANSMFRRVVTEEHNQILKAHGDEEFKNAKYFNNNKNASGQAWWKSESAITVPLVLERPDSAPGNHVQSALGAINLETSELDYYKPPEIEEFIKSIALSASRHITALRTTRFAEEALRLAISAYSQRPDELWQGAHESLFTLLGHNHLIQFEPPPDWDNETIDTPWIVKRVFSSDPTRYTNDIRRWNQHFGNLKEWPGTFIKECIRIFISKPDSQPLFTADEKKFQQSTDLLNEEKIEANAVFPLRESRQVDKGLHGVVLLSWFSPPVMSKSMFESVLGEFARYCTVLLRHSEDRLTGEERLRRAENQAGIAFAARQFEHILNNRLAALQGDAEAGLQSTDLTQTHSILSDMRQQLKRLDERASKSALYLKEPRMQTVILKDVWTAVTEELAEKAKRSNATLWPWGESPIKYSLSSHPDLATTKNSDTSIESDDIYLWNALYVLVDNALDALEQNAIGMPRDVWIEAFIASDKWQITVHDNGPGISHPENLFIFGKSTKNIGQGVALALAKERLGKIGVNLHWNPKKPPGTAFQLSAQKTPGDMP